MTDTAEDNRDCQRDLAPARSPDFDARVGTPPDLKVFGIGLSRTGTTSLNRALEIVGHRAVHFPSDQQTQIELCRFLDTPTSELRLTLLETVDVLTDTPVSAVYQALDRAYVNSRFIMTVRERSSWLASCRTYWAQVLTPILRSASAQEAAYVRRVNRAVYGTDTFDARRFADAYDRHLAAAREHFRARHRDYLEIDVCAGQGWSALCAFLGLDEPPSAFPWANAHQRLDDRRATRAERSSPSATGSRIAELGARTL